MKRAIIMGASSGIGQEVARLLFFDGWTIGVAARREEALIEWKQKQLAFLTKAENQQATSFAEKIFTMSIDVCEPDAPQKLILLIERLGGIDLYIHASGIGKQNPYLETDIELNTVRTNGLGFTQMMDTVFRYMAENDGGHIVAISSIAGTKGLALAPSYSATKAFQNTYIEALEQLADNRHLKICFTDIRPGFVDTPLLAGGKYPMLLDKRMVAKKIMRAIQKKKHVYIIDWRWRIMTFLWGLIPRFIWRRWKLFKKR